MSDPFHQRPWTMGFADAEMERRYIEEQARVTRGPMRAALAVVAVMWLVLALTVDRLLFPPATGIMHTLRAGSEVVFALAAAFVSFGSSKAYLRWWQLVLDVTTLVAALYPTAVGLALTATFGRELDAVWPTVHLQWLISVTLAIVAAHVLCRFAHATSISVVATAAYLVALVLARAIDHWLPEAPPATGQANAS